MAFVSAGATALPVRLHGVTKRFGAAPVLSGIDLEIAPGAVHGLVGENGAGKSTLSKIIAGVLTADEGTLSVGDRAHVFHSPRDALDHGIATIAQELALVPGLTVAENVFLGAEPARAGFVRRRRLRAAFAELARSTGFDLDPDAVVATLRTADQQKVEILRALARGAWFIIMDEPTAALSGPDVELLHDVVRTLARSGRTVLLISHFLSEVLELSDTVTILRDGRHIRTAPAREETEASLIEGMLGRSLGSVFPDRTTPVPDAPDVLTVERLQAPGVEDVSFTVRAGEIVGLAGLVGAGRSEIAHAVFGAVRSTASAVRVDGAPLTRHRIGDALRRGVFLLPESRKEQGLVAQLSVRENVTMGNLAALSTLNWIRRRQERRTAQRMLQRVGVQGDDSRSVTALSGGNQQKVMFGRALQRPRRVLIADEPTRGVDVGSRRAIYELIAEQASAGVGVLVISSDVEEVLGLAHRVLVVRAGRIVAELSGDELTEQNILTAAFAERAATDSDEGEGAR
ncbi:sugar ABC transporter ATP-binding protein [Microbacterium sp.]|uniref:sugar ABC transporter ATP-binding protein n=1 Tax=Microbacterium sp. TaxID=51671 RepID=UPI0037C6D0F6